MARHHGFDYETNAAVQRTRAEWRNWIRAAVERGCYVRAERGETFIHRRVPHGPTIVAEVYATPGQLGVANL